MRRIGALLLLAALVAAPVASAAKRKHLKLTAVVTGHKVETVEGFTSKVALYSVKHGSKKVGTLSVSTLGGCVGNTCIDAGTANLTVGKVTGAAKLHTVETLTGCPPCSPPIPVKFKSNTGTIFKFTAQHKSKALQEAIRVNGEWPSKKGSKVTSVLSY